MFLIFFLTVNIDTNPKLLTLQKIQQIIRVTVLEFKGNFNEGLKPQKIELTDQSLFFTK